jgi:hypothetical protein
LATVSWLFWRVLKNWYNDANARIRPLESPRQDGSNGGQIIKIWFFNINRVNNESIVSNAT